MSIPITVVTGFLGAGKTTLILSLLPQLSKDYKVVLLKNEFGDVEVDSKLASQSNLMAVSEILNGCMCCVLVGQMQNALLEIQEKYAPDRIIVETSGSAFPATLAFQIRELERQTSGSLKLDAIITVVDAENFSGYADSSATAKMQSSYTDIMVINKWELVSDRQLDIVLDHLYTLNEFTPKIRCKGKDGVDPKLIFGIETDLFLEGGNQDEFSNHHDEVQTVTIYRGPSDSAPRSHEHSPPKMQHSTSEIQTAELQMSPIGRAIIEQALLKLSKESVWRIKGFIDIADEGPHILNWAFGRYELTPFHEIVDFNVKLTVMGERGDVKRSSRSFASSLGATIL